MFFLFIIKYLSCNLFFKNNDIIYKKNLLSIQITYLYEYFPIYKTLLTNSFLTFSLLKLPLKLLNSFSLKYSLSN